MPVASSIQELIDALQTKKTRTMRALDCLFGSASALETVDHHPERHQLAANPDVFRTLPDWAVLELRAAPGSTGLVKEPLSDEEIQHINDWPAANKRVLVGVLDTAISDRQPLQFFWELHGAATETIDVSNAREVYFRSPQANVSVSGWAKFLANLLADIRVQVGSRHP
jgi:hypothetical protein